MAKVIGLDVGDKRIGVAIGDTDLKLAWLRPAIFVQSADQTWAAIKELVTAESIQLIIVGWPLSLSGDVGPQAEQTQKFITALRTQVLIPVIKRDERLTTQAVKREQAHADRHLSPGAVDSLAAQLLVEQYLQEAAP